ncbi:conserved hypothetical protein [Vibrio chagasii]|nr:hypothetical protein BCU43_19910 [Vibrio lentus]PMI85648.1 hypothetical protein BCU35_17625 [Vibrio lentus]CAH7057954.1 conserved hypothetical protein [Vibrio chagasii]CAH7086844.1 conserved hypothetical protein [Vibrio chagasii]CAH7279785.1 conserved hypothetical protein [Vibrio chagasii]
MSKCYVRKNDGSLTEAFRTGRKHKASCKVEGERFTSKYTFVTFSDKPNAKEYMISDSNILSEQEFLDLLKW